MNPNALTKHYPQLTAQERFALIVSAGARGDSAEQDRLAAVGESITVSLRDFVPIAHAFHDLALPIFMDLLETAAVYFDTFQGAADDELLADAPEEPDDGAAEAPEAAADVPEVGSAESGAGEVTDKRTRPDFFALARGMGYLLKTKAAGWQLFCERLAVPPFAVWECLPGFPRLQRALQVAEHAAFVSECMVRFINEVRPPGAPEVIAADMLSAAQYADSLEVVFRERVKSWGG